MDNEEIIPDNVEIQVNNPPITEKAEPSLWDEIKTSKNIKEEISTSDINNIKSGVTIWIAIRFYLI
jgi:hypothetical protein